MRVCDRVQKTSVLHPAEQRWVCWRPRADEVTLTRCLHLFWLAVFIDSEAGGSTVRTHLSGVQQAGSADVNFIASEFLNRSANPV